MFVSIFSGREQYYLLGYFEGKCCFQLQSRGQETRNDQEVNSKPLALCLLFGMFFTASLCHIKKMVTAERTSDPIFRLLLLGREKKSYWSPRGMIIIFVLPLVKETEFHINWQSGFSENGIPMDWQQSAVYIKANEVCRFKSNYIEI
jgi:hypothetical protein